MSDSEEIKAAVEGLVAGAERLGEAFAVFRQVLADVVAQMWSSFSPLLGLFAWEAAPTLVGVPMSDICRIDVGPLHVDVLTFNWRTIQMETEDVIDWAARRRVS